MYEIRRSVVLFLWMYTLTFVKSQDCTRDQFINSDMWDSNFDTTDMELSYLGGKQVRVSCNVGYTGFFRLLCVEGKWQSRGTRCQPKSCGHPGDAQFADFHLEKGDDFVFGSQVVYNCHKGYQMVSRKNYRTCMAAGWDGVVPVCEAQQCPAIHIPDNLQVNGDAEEATYGNVVRFSCKYSIEILYGPTEIYCDENGQWSDNAPRCEAVKCKVPQIEHGRVTGEDRDYNEHEILHFECDARYGKAEQRPSKCTKIGQRADWSPTPTCEPIKCKLQVSQLKGSSYEPAYRNVFSPGEILRVTCGEKYWISTPWDTSAEVTCRDNGEWTLDPICKEVTCSRPYGQPIDYWDNYWEHKKTLGDTVRYRCRTGYQSTDRATWATCTRGGWTPDPLCQEITCDRREIPNAGIENAKEKYKDYERANYVCNEGYRGRFTLTCRESGWVGHPRCTEITCEPRPHSEGNIVNYKTIYKYKEQAQYSCRDGYRGGFSLTCTERGWEGQAACTEITCDRRDIPNAAIENTKEKYTFSERVNYVCNEGYRGRFTLTCREGGWEGEAECTECQKPEFPNGFIVGPDENKMYFYTCNEGYKLLTKGWWSAAKCNDSVLPELHQCIENTTCDLPDIPNGKVTPQQINYEHGASVDIICNQGYQVEVVTLTCHEGKWPEGLQQICTPIANYCPPPPKVKNAVVVTPYQKEYLSDSEVTYQCRESYTIEGNDRITCKNGEWQNLNISCTSVQTTVTCEPPPEGLIVKRLPEDQGPILPDHYIEISCPPEKTLSGGSQLSCGQDGQWNAPFPTCEEIACIVDVMHPKLNATGLTPENKTVNVGQTLRFHCDREFTMEGPEEIQCLKTGKWSEPFPTCNVKPCELPDDIPNGYYQIVHGEDFVFGTTIKYFCNEGYQMISRADTRTCSLSKWTNHVPVCEPLSCEPPPEELITRGLQEEQGAILPDRFIEISCPPGKRINGSSVLVCGKNGTWNSPFPTCEAVTCEPPPEGLIVKRLPEHQGPILPDHYIEISCPDEKTLNGSSRLSCGQDGQWNPPMPTCEDKCRFTGAAQGVKVTPRPAPGRMFNRGQKLQFSCYTLGHVLHGNAEVECLGNGKWRDPFPTCGSPSRCGRPPPLANGDTKFLTKYNYNHNDRVEYVCQTHYTMNGGSFKICNNGNWTGNIRCLRPCTVDKEIMSKHNIAFKHSWEEKLYSPHEDFLTFTCKRHTQPVGTLSMRQQCIDGVMSLPTCR